MRMFRPSLAVQAEVGSMWNEETRRAYRLFRLVRALAVSRRRLFISHTLSLSLSTGRVVRDCVKWRDRGAYRPSPNNVTSSRSRMDGRQMYMRVKQHIATSRLHWIFVYKRPRFDLQLVVNGVMDLTGVSSILWFLLFRYFSIFKLSCDHHKNSEIHCHHENKHDQTWHLPVRAQRDEWPPLPKS